MTKRILCVDYGDTRTGLAITDELGMLAHGIGYIKEKYPPYTADKVVEKAKEYGVETIVLGYPINMNGTHGPRTQKADEFKTLLAERCECNIVLFDERVSTMSAHTYLNYTNTRGKNRKEVIDTLSAEIILQNYIDSLKNISSDSKI